jgi:hypothetical protein
MNILAKNFLTIGLFIFGMSIQNILGLIAFLLSIIVSAGFLRKQIHDGTSIFQSMKKGKKDE